MITTDNITDEQIRELRDTAHDYGDGDPDFVVRICNWALRTTDPRIYVTADAQAKADSEWLSRRRPRHRARCAEILNTRGVK